MKHLILLRHAKADWAENGLDDFDRPLSNDGQGECQLLAPWLIQNDLLPDHALVSPALRTRQTWESVCNNLPDAPPHDTHDDLYLAAPGTLLAHISALPDIVGTALVVAHNPGLEALARMLAGASPDDAAMRDMMLGYPTAGLAKFTVDTDHWDQISVATTRLDVFLRPQAMDD
ncbi:MAG: histidine phosphatase family protein [Rhodospirillaceae bacterium]|jgi:phosphohistidine phosphatase|nr:histidine phosphatase family protein [Rhodospirillaceae bacterium]MBT3930285.1 histidine phosphatase family protein [Rhodospirillaceae bacterium]MBT4771940.1 histidine phosphatase family protein [Rhodospirillaceae bacterium]MBT5359905.1 histidine phosphatase family protein [Rhodospirillaceae bacterium]MBT5768187.1 histidine phosphatase family protein [Rhodospirillaceae bacterium]